MLRCPGEGRADVLRYYGRDIREEAGADAVVLVECLQDVWDYGPDGVPRSAVVSYYERHGNVQATTPDGLVGDDLTEDEIEELASKA